jgi:hypothetical protein
MHGRFIRGFSGPRWQNGQHWIAVWQTPLPRSAADCARNINGLEIRAASYPQSCPQRRGRDRGREVYQPLKQRAPGQHTWPAPSYSLPPLPWDIRDRTGHCGTFVPD